MNRQELVEKLLTKTKREVTPTDMNRIVTGFIEEIRNAVAAGDTVQLIGLGTFKCVNRSERTAHNIKTGETMRIPAKKAPRFVPGTAFKEAVNK